MAGDDGAYEYFSKTFAEPRFKSVQSKQSFQLYHKREHRPTLQLRDSKAATPTRNNHPAKAASKNISHLQSWQATAMVSTTSAVQSI